MRAAIAHLAVGGAGSGRWIVAMIGVLVLLSALAMPKRDNVNNCIAEVRLGLGLSYAHNCDSRHITRDASDIGRYLGEDTPSRARPVYIAAVAAIAHVLSPVLVPLAAQLKPLRRHAGGLLVFYLAAIVFNIGVVALAYGLLTRLVDGGASLAARTSLMALVASYDVTLAWFWVPHQILMNLVAPLGAVLSFIWGMRASKLAVRTLVGLGLATAAACLTYGYCLVWPLAVALGLAFNQMQERRIDVVGFVAALVPYGLAVSVPIVAWVGGFSLAGREAAYEAQSVGQFQWTGIALAQGNLVAEAAWRAVRLGKMVAGIIGPMGWLTAMGVGLLLVLTWHRGQQEGRSSDPVLVGALVALCLMLLFNYLQGYHQARLLMFPVLLGQLALLRLLVVGGFGQWVPAVAGGIAILQVAGGFLAPPTSME